MAEGAPRAALSLAVLAAAAAAAACAPRPPPGAVLGDAVRVCEGDRCEFRPTASASFRPEDAARGDGRQQDPNAYRGEDLGQLRAAAQAGDPGAAYRLGLVHQQGLAGAPRDPRLAARHFETAAVAGDPWTRFGLAQVLDASGADRARSLELKAAAARAGVGEAAAALGTQYREGRGGAPRDAAEAARWFQVAAENGAPEAQCNLGLMHYRGEGVPRQLHEALRWMRQAAANGHVPAQRAVGQLYLTGLDTVGQDFQEARTWLAAAASRSGCSPTSTAPTRPTATTCGASGFCRPTPPGTGAPRPTPATGGGPTATATRASTAGIDRESSIAL